MVEIQENLTAFAEPAPTDELPDVLPTNGAEFPENWSIDPPEGAKSGSRFYRVTGRFSKEFGMLERQVMVVQLSGEEDWRAVTGSGKRENETVSTGTLAEVGQETVLWAWATNMEYLELENISLPDDTDQGE